MQWSRFNLLFKSKRNGWLLYNSASNAIVQMDDESAKLATDLSENPNVDFSQNPDIYFKLRFGGFLVEDGKDDDIVRILKMERLKAAYSGSTLALGIALTRECNFGCPYCFVGNKKSIKISDNVEDKIVKFITTQKLNSKISVVWYGGEPLLEFDRIKSLTKKIQAIGKQYTSNLYTNGFLLTPEIISSFNDLGVDNVKITIDGSKNSHNKQRTLVDGGATYDIIMANIDNLVTSDWAGNLTVRVNIQPSNRNDFAAVCDFFRSKYLSLYDNRICVTPGYIVDFQNNFDVSRCGTSDYMGEFLVDSIQKKAIESMAVFPTVEFKGCCALTKQSAYVIGPEGELYKCVLDLGEESEIVGWIDDFKNQNMSLIAEGIVGASYLEDSRCLKCFFFPICDGVCPKIRMINNRDGGDRDNCTHYKSHIRDFVELYFERKLTEKRRYEQLN